jgi:hypothetical protein
MQEIIMASARPSSSEQLTILWNNVCTALIEAGQLAQVGPQNQRTIFKNKIRQIKEQKHSGKDDTFFEKLFNLEEELFSLKNNIAEKDQIQTIPSVLIDELTKDLMTYIKNPKPTEADFLTVVKQMDILRELLNNLPNKPQGKVNDYIFEGQGRIPSLTSLSACSSISVMMLSELVAMPETEFFHLFSADSNSDSKAQAYTALTYIVKKGIELNVSLASHNANLFWKVINLVQPKSVNNIIKGVKEIDNNVAKEVVSLEYKEINSTSARLNEYCQSMIAKYKEIGYQAEDIAFMSTADTHTISFFSKKDPSGKQYYFIVDSSSLSSKSRGLMEMHDNLNSALTSVLKIAGNDATMGIATVTLNQKTQQLKEKMLKELSYKKK